MIFHTQVCTYYLYDLKWILINKVGRDVDWLYDSKTNPISFYEQFY